RRKRFRTHRIQRPRGCRGCSRGRLALVRARGLSRRLPQFRARPPQRSRISRRQSQLRDIGRCGRRAGRLERRAITARSPFRAARLWRTIPRHRRRRARVDDLAGIRRSLRQSRTIAVVGLSAQWYRPSYFAAKYMQDHGYRIVPVNPNYSEVLGEKCYAKLTDIPVPVDIVDCFRKPEEMPAIARDAVIIHAKVLWMQL